MEASLELEQSAPKKFTEEARKSLEKKGFLIYELTGKTLSELEELGIRIAGEWWEEEQSLTGKTSRKSEVAITPEFYLFPDHFNPSRMFTFAEKQQAVEKFSNSLSRRIFGKGIKGVEAVIGEIPDYAELILQTKDKKSMFSKDVGGIYTNTNIDEENKFWIMLDKGIVIIGKVGNIHSKQFAPVAPLIVPSN